MAKSGSRTSRGSQSSMNSVVLIAALAIGAVLFSTTAMKNGGGGGGSDVVLDPNLDTDGDGVIEANELVTVAKPAQLNNDLDLDGDGTVEDHELDENFFARHRVSLLCASSSVIILFAVLYMQWKAAKEEVKETKAAADKAAEKAAADAEKAKATADKAVEKAAADAEKDVLRRTPTDAHNRMMEADRAARKQAAIDAGAARNQAVIDAEAALRQRLSAYDQEHARTEAYFANSPDRYIRAAAASPSPIKARVEKKFNTLDADGNGLLDKKEVLQLAEWAWTSLRPGQTITEEQKQAEADSIWAQCDGNHDGYVDKVEFEKYYDAQNAAIQQFYRDQAAQNREAANLRASENAAAAYAATLGKL